MSRPISFPSVVCLLLWFAVPARAELPTHDTTGGYSLSVSFDYGSLVESGYLADGVDGFTDERYCGIFEKASHHLWQVTEGQHWIKSVDFRLGLAGTDINWDFVNPSMTNYGTFNSRIQTRENYGDSRSPSANPAPTPGELDEFDERLAWTLVHEFGHYNYQVWDEYAHGRESKGSLGLCANYTGGTCNADSSILCTGDTVCDDANPGDTCDAPTKSSCDDDSDCFGHPCMKPRPSKVCSNYTSDPSTIVECENVLDCEFPHDCIDLTLFLCAGLGWTEKYCWIDEHCQQDGDTGWCVREGQGGQPSSRSVCRNRDAPLPMEPDEDRFRNRTSGMASPRQGGRWCDSTTHLHDRVIQNLASGDFDQDGTPGNDPEYKLAICADPRCPGSDCPEDLETEDCLDEEHRYRSAWDRAARTDLTCADDDEECLDQISHPDLRSYYEDPLEYSAWVDLDWNAFTGAVDFGNEENGFLCAWRIDPVPVPGDNTVIVLDKSGSMDYDVGVTQKSAFEWAAEGVLAAVEQTDGQKWVGVNPSVSSILVPGVLPIQDFVRRDQIIMDDVEDALANVVPEGPSSMAGSIQQALNLMQGQGTDGNRNIILMSDLLMHALEGTLAYGKAVQACEANVVVNTVTYGDRATAIMKDIADACGGESMVAATDGVLPEGVDPHLLKTDLIAMKYLVQGLDRILIDDEHGQLSDNEDLQTRAFIVPSDPAPLTFTWIGNDVPYCAEFDGDACNDLRQVWSELQFSLVGPSQQDVPGVIGHGFHTVARVTDPEPGLWTARVDASAVPLLPGLRDATRVSWMAHVDHGDLLARAWVDDWKKLLDEPVLVNAMLSSEVPLTNVVMLAHVTKRGVAYQPFGLFDDGENGDGDAGDGLFGGWFNLDGNFFTEPGGYNVKVTFASAQGLSRPVFVEEPGESGDYGRIVAPDALLEAETLFHLYAHPLSCGVPPIDCPGPEGLFLSLSSLPQGAGLVPNVVAQVDELPLIENRVAVDLGPGVGVENLQMMNDTPDPGGPQQGTLAFDVFVENDARVGTHTASVWVGDRKATTTFEITCGAVDLAPPRISAPRTTVQICGASADVGLTLPSAIDECSAGAPVTITGEIHTINGQNLEPPIEIDPGGTSGPVVTLPLGYAIVRWTATDWLGNAASRNQRIDVELDATCFGAGAVPDGSGPGQPLRIDKVTGGQIELAWAGSCSPNDGDYEIYEGTLGDFTSHAPLLCSTGGQSSAILTPAAASSYYLVVPRTPLREGSYGVNGSGSERPQGTSFCLLQQLGACGPGTPGP